jgi:hypothetical protein
MKTSFVAFLLSLFVGFTASAEKAGKAVCSDGFRSVELDYGTDRRVVLNGFDAVGTRSGSAFYCIAGAGTEQNGGWFEVARWVCEDPLSTSQILLQASTVWGVSTVQLFNAAGLPVFHGACFRKM